VKLRFFGGMTNEEIAVLLEVSVTTVKRRWLVAKAWLCEALNRQM
jgi:DNA-directed RNA polymerase specialized sigma24 family protein